MATKYATGHIGRRAAENALHGIRFAAEQGRPLNTQVTISFIELGIDDTEAGTIFQAFQGRVGRWWAYQRDDKGRDLGPLMGVHSHANPAGSRHVDWLTHVPPEALPDFRAVLKNRLQKLTGRIDLGDALHIQTIDTPGSLAKYIFRGIDPAYAAYLHIEAANEGLVSGRRTGASRAISRAARRRAGWVRKKPKAQQALKPNADLRPQPGQQRVKHDRKSAPGQQRRVKAKPPFEQHRDQQEHRKAGDHEPEGRASVSRHAVDISRVAPQPEHAEDGN